MNIVTLEEWARIMVEDRRRKVIFIMGERQDETMTVLYRAEDIVRLITADLNKKGFRVKLATLKEEPTGGFLRPGTLNGEFSALVEIEQMPPFTYTPETTSQVENPPQESK